MASSNSMVTQSNIEVSVEPNVDYTGCDVCGEGHDTDECPIFSVGRKVEDTTAPSRARLTLPKTLQVRDLADGTTTVITTDNIAAATQFGPLEAKRTPDFNLVTRFQLKVFNKDGSFVYLDATSEKDCNWMSLVAVATNEDELNLIAYQVRQDIFFSTVKPIEPGKELRVWYAPHYGKKMGITAPWEPGGKLLSSVHHSASSDSATVVHCKVVRKRGRKPKPKVEEVYAEDDEEETDDATDVVDDATASANESESLHKEVLETLDPRRLGFKEVREWKCSQCGCVFANCLDFAHHLSNHYKPRPPGAKRRDAGIKRPKNYPCEICGQKFTTERLCHRHTIRQHKRSLRKMKKCQVILEDLKHTSSEARRDHLPKVQESNIELPIIKKENCDESMADAERLLSVEITVLDPPDAFETNKPSTIIVNQTKMDISQISQGELKNLKFEESKMEENRSDCMYLARKERLNSQTPEDESRMDKIIDSDIHISTTHDLNNSLATVRTLESVIRDIITPEEGELDLEGDMHSSMCADRLTTIGPNKKSRGKSTKSGKYKCDICHKRFEQSIYLFRHIRKHTGDFTCLQCHKVFARKESMIKHHCPGMIGDEGTASFDFTCDQCNKTFGNERLLKRHHAKHSGEFTCSECFKSYTSRDILLSHSCSKNPVMERYVCEICHKTFTKLKYLDKHIPVHTGIFSCPICGKWLRSNDSLINHMRICGQVKELEANGTAVCPHCREEFTDLKAFRRHMYDHTHMFSCDSCGARFRNKLSLGLHVCNAERSIPCDECNKVFNSIASLNRHRLSHGDPQFHCGNCGRSYHRKETLLKHPCERVKRSKSRADKKPPSLLPLICEICGSMFSSTSSLNVHRNLHGEKKFACEMCGKRFHRKDLLIEHMAVHGQAEIPCPVCSKLFKTKKSLDVHLLIHDGIKRFKCQTCGKMFYQKGNLQKHEETHTPGRRHTCPHCNKSFSSKEYLTIHVLEHTRGRIFVCASCGRSFVKEHQLKAHKRVFHGNQAYVCKYCGLSVKLRHSLKRHLEKKHASMRSEWDSNESIAAMLMKRVIFDETEEDVLDYQNQETIITEVSPTQGAEVLLAVAGIGSEALQQAIAAGTARIQQGAAPNTIEISLPVEGDEITQVPIISEGVEGTDETRTVIQHVVTEQDEIMQGAGHIHIVSAEDEDGVPQIVMEGESGQEHTLSNGNTIVLENGTILQPSGEGENPTDLLLYVLTTSESQETQ